MKKLSLLICIICFSTIAKTQHIEVFPPNWYTQMQDSTLQIIVKAKGISSFKLTNAANEISVTNSIPSNHPDYLLLNLKITKNAKPGFKKLIFSKGSAKIKIDFELKEKNKRPVPALEQNDFIYLLMPDRFANADVKNDVIKNYAETSHNRKEPFDRHGGDLKGIQERLPYLKSLGATALWLTPFQENNEASQSYHGYAITNHYQTDPRYGNNQDYFNLVNACHQQNQKVIIDLVYNHIGDRHWMNTDQPFPSFIHQFDTFTRTNYRANTLMDPYAAAIDKKIFTEGWFDKHMPDLNLKDSLIAKYMIQQTLWWLNEAKVDGIRIDTYSYPEESFMKKCYQAIRKEYPEMSIFAEIWEHAVPLQSYFTPKEKNKMEDLQQVLDFQFCFAMDEFVQQPFGWTEGVSKLYYSLSQDFLYRDPYHHVTFIDNHDQDRFLSQVGGDINKLKTALGVMLTMRGIPTMFYGTEVLMQGKGPHGVIREDFSGGWPGDLKNKFEAIGRSESENDLWNYIQNLAKWRVNCDAIANGKLMQFAPQDGVYTYFRYSNNKTVMVSYNSNANEVNIDLNRFKERINSSFAAYDVIHQQQTNFNNKLKLAAKEIKILEIN
jgi:glycosidase